MGREKKHHFVPASYLKRFTRSGLDTGDLWTFDAVAGRFWKGTPLSSAHARDYNLIEADGVDPFTAEKDIFGSIETAATSVFDLLEREARASLASNPPALTVAADVIEQACLFMAAQVIRAPSRRAALDAFETDLAQQVLELTADSEELFDSVRTRHGIGPDLTLEGLRAMLADPSAKLRVVGTPTTHLAATLPSLVPVAQVLMARRWSVLLTPPTRPFMVTSDAPVALVPERLEPYFFGVGFATPGSRVFFPLSRTACLFGDDVQPGHPVRPVMAVLAPHARHAGVVNSITVGHADRYVYSGESDFAWLAPDDVVRDGMAFLATARRLRGSPE